ncbi:MAG: LamG-like jellyroll fold domain-containing protein [Rhodothermales bacterium]|nr:LamG-like jellyroll fold domain-containing protein [Rhodothermales bacterium]
MSQNVEFGPFLDQRELIARGPGGWGLAPPWSAEFDGVSSTMRSDGIDPISQPLGPKLTVEAWFRASSTSGRVVLLTNQGPAGDGFVLGLSDGIPFLELVYGPGSFRVDATVPVEPGSDAWVAGTVRYDGTATVTLTIHVNGRHAGEQELVATFATPYTVNAPFYLGTTTSGDPLAPTMVSAFEGHIFMAVARDYVTHPFYLTSGVPFDGGEYLGLPSYHDYPLDQFHLPMDQRIDDEPVEVDRRFFLPYANDEFIPQGTATREGSAGGDDTDLVYVSYYHRTREGTIETMRSIVVEIDAATGIVRRTFRLRGALEYSHAGGIAIAGDAFFISSVGFLERYEIPDYEGPSGPKYIDLGPDASGSISVLSKSSFVSAFEDTLWVGDWRPSNDVEPFLYAYPLAADGRPERTAAYVYAIPRNIQGVDLIRRNGQTYVFMSRNRNSREAELLRFKRQQLHRSIIPSPDSVVTMPFGIEDLSFSPDGSLWTNSESGTVYYQRRDVSPWQAFYPFVYRVPEHAVLPSAVDVSVTDEDVPIDIGLWTYPNPVREIATITVRASKPAFLKVYIVDLLGRTQVSLSEGFFTDPSATMRWNVSGVPSGLYFAVVHGEQGRLVKPVVVAR